MSTRTGGIGSQLPGLTRQPSDPPPLGYHARCATDLPKKPPHKDEHWLLFNRIDTEIRASMAGLMTTLLSAQWSLTPSPHAE